MQFRLYYTVVAQNCDSQKWGTFHVNVGFVQRRDRGSLAKKTCVSSLNSASFSIMFVSERMRNYAMPIQFSR